MSSTGNIAASAENNVILDWLLFDFTYTIEYSSFVNFCCFVVATFPSSLLSFLPCILKWNILLRASFALHQLPVVWIIQNLATICRNVRLIAETYHLPWFTLHHIVWLVTQHLAVLVALWLIVKQNIHFDLLWTTLFGT